MNLLPVSVIRLTRVANGVAYSCKNSSSAKNVLLWAKGWIVERGNLL